MHSGGGDLAVPVSRDSPVLAPAKAASRIPINLVIPPEYGLVDPYLQPGHLQFDPSDPLAARWKPFDALLSNPDWTELMRLAGNLPLPNPHQNPAEPTADSIVDPPQYPLSEYSATEREEIQQEMLKKIDHLRNSTILMLGDNSDRNTVDQFGILFQSSTWQESFNGSEVDPMEPRSSAYPHICRIGEQINLTIASGLMYGIMDDVEDFSYMPNWIAHGKAEDRVEQLFKVFTDRRESPPSLIVLHSGMWDLAFFGRQDKATSTSTNTPLADERLVQWQNRMTSMIRKVKVTWPGVPIVLRKSHRVGSTHGSAEWQLDDPHVVNYFTDVRIHQIRAMQQHIAQQEGIAIFDFGVLFEGFQRYQDGIYPLLYPGGLLMANGLMHQAYLARHDPFYNAYSTAIPRRNAGQAYLRHSRIAAYLLDKADSPKVPAS